MTSFLSESKERSAFFGATALTLLILGLAACQPDRETKNEDASPIVGIRATDYAFAAPDSIRSGWTSFRMANEGEAHHLFTLLRLPEGVSYEDFQREVVANYDSVWAKVVGGTINAFEASKRLGPLFPDWYPSEIVQTGGVSLTAPGQTARTTLLMKPGTYVIECYALTPERQFHALLGMVQPLTVYKDSSDAGSPKADERLTVSNLGLKGVGPVPPGERTFGVRFKRDPEGAGAGEGHQHLHLARLNEGGAVEGLVQWADRWIGENPVLPAPTEFLGGAQHMPAGNTAYVTVEFEPGRYAWLLGVPPENGEIKSFAVE